MVYRIKSMRLNNCENLMNFLFLLSIIGVLSAFLSRRESVRELISDSPISSAFRDFPLILSAVMCTIAVTIPIALELILDIIFNWKCGIDDRMERVSMILIVIVPGVIFLCSYKSVDLPFIFCCLHAVQYVGCFGAILSLCHKLIPEYFTLKRLAFVQFFFMSASVFSMYGFGHPLFNWINVVVLFQIPISLGSFCFFTFKWLKSLHLDLSYSSLLKISTLSMNQITCLLYIGSTMMTIISLPGIAAATKLLAWEFYDLPIVLIFIYSLVGFCLIPSCVPGRIARYYHSEQIIKRATLRYLSHEIRSPLNVVCNGLMFIKQDLVGCSQEIMENLNDIEFASESAVSILNDFLDFDKIESGLHKSTPTLVTIERFISTMIKPLGIFARQKGLEFEINYLFTESRLSNVGLFIDKNKMTQVFRNLIINAVKFTPSNKGKVTVSVRDADSINTLPEILPEATKIGVKQWHNTFLESIMLTNSFKRRVSPVEALNVQQLDQDTKCPDHQRDIIIEVTDTGSGIPDHVRHQIFEEFFQFDPDKLQGGGGSGLGLWICKEIVQQHKGSITFKPGPNNIGTTFSVRLKKYSLALSDVYPIGCEEERKNDNYLNNHEYSSRRHNFLRDSSLSNRVLESETRVLPLQHPSCIQPLSCKHNSSNNNTASSRGDGNSDLTLPPQDVDCYFQNSIFTGSIDEENSFFRDNRQFLFDVDVHSNRRVSPRPPTVKQLHVLVVDDSELNRRMMRRSVQRVLHSIDSEGFEVQFDDADDGLSAIELVRTSLATTRDRDRDGDGHKGYDIIFMDNIMLKMNGPEAAKAIREMGYQGRIIGVTGNTLPKDIEEFLNFGANEVLTKPVDMEHLRFVLLELM